MLELSISTQVASMVLASAGDQPSLGETTALWWALLGKKSEEQPPMAQVTGRKDSFYWPKLYLTRLPVSPGVYCFRAGMLDIQKYSGISG